MVKEVKYNGYTAQPNEYVSEDGELTMSMNLISEDGGLKAISKPKVLFSMDEGDRLMYIKRVELTSHYIITNGNTIYWREENDDEKHEIKDFGTEEIKQVNSIGNTLLVLTGEGLHYFLWKAEQYRYLGNELPDLSVRPYLDTELRDSTLMLSEYDEDIQFITNAKISGEGVISTNIMQKLLNNLIDNIYFHGSIRENVYNRVFSIINQGVSLLEREGLFVHPFYVRFAYRMFDGTHVKHTPPMLLSPVITGQPILPVDIEADGTAICHPILPAATLYAKFNIKEDIALWEDIITHVDVFVSAPLVNYTDDAKSLVSVSVAPGWSYVNDGEAGNTWEVKNRLALPLTMTTIDGAAVLTDILTTDEEKRPEGLWKVNKDAIIRGGRSYLFRNSLEGYRAFYYVFDTSDAPSFAITSISGQTIPPSFTSAEAPFEKGSWAAAVHASLPMGLTYKAYIYKLLNNQQIILSDDARRYRVSGPPEKTAREISTPFAINLERVDGKSFLQTIQDTANFYKVSELKISEIPIVSENREELIESLLVPIERYTLSNIEAFPTLSDLGQSIHLTIPSRMISYNNRLNVIVDKEKIKSGGVSVGQLNSHYRYNGPSYTITLMTYAYVELNENGQIVYTPIELEERFGENADYILENIIYYSFPSLNAKRLVVGGTDKQGNLQEKYISLIRHPFLSQSYAFNGFSPLQFEDLPEAERKGPPSTWAAPENIIYYNNIIKASTVENPFHTPESLQSQLPVNRVYSLATATIPLSEGQFGQFPLYAFTDEGVWALSIDDEGVFKGKQAITMDVCNNIDAITQLDKEVLFPTDRGIMLLSGSESVCISSAIDSDTPTDLTELPKINKIIELSGLDADMFDIVPFKEYLLGCDMVYDYIHQRIVLYNRTKRYAYVWSLKDKAWGMMESDIQYGVNSYPEALVIDSENRVINLSSEDDVIPKGLMITRALKLEGADLLKAIDAVIQRGYFDRGDVSTILWGSRDMKSWHLIWTSKDQYLRGFKGTPFKYFRVGAIANLDKEKSLVGATINFNPKQTNQLR